MGPEARRDESRESLPPAPGGAASIRLYGCVCITLAPLLIEGGESESHELPNSFWMGPGGSWDLHGVQRIRRGALGS